MMRRVGLVVLVVVGCVGFAAALAARFTAPVPVYTVAEVQARLMGQPGQWVGRTVLVRGVVVGSSSAVVCTSSGGACAVRNLWTVLSAAGGTAGRTAYPIGLSTAIGSHASVVTRPGRGALQRDLVTMSIPLSSLAPAAKLVVALPPAGQPVPVSPARPLPAALYALPFAGPLVSRYFPHAATVYRVRLLDPRSCVSQVGYCPDATFAP